MEIAIKETSIISSSTDMEHTLGLMVIHILEIGSMTNNMVMAFISSQMEPGIKANFMKVNLLEKEF